MLVEGRHFFAGRRRPKARPQDARGEPVRPGGDGRDAALGAARAARCPTPTTPGSRHSPRLFRARRRAWRRIVGGDTTRGPLNLCVTVFGEVPRRPGAARARRAAGRRHLGLRHARRRGAGGRALQRRLALAPAALERALRARSTGRTRASRWRWRCAASPAPRSTFPTGWPAISATSSSVAASAPTIDSRATAALGRARRDARAARTRTWRSQCLLAGGDDYELCFTAPPRRAPHRGASRGTLALPLTRIGIARAATRGLSVRDEPAMRSRRCRARSTFRAADCGHRAMRNTPTAALPARASGAFRRARLRRGLVADRSGHVRHAARAPARLRCCADGRRRGYRDRRRRRLRRRRLGGRGHRARSRRRRSRRDRLGRDRRVPAACCSSSAPTPCAQALGVPAVPRCSTSSSRRRAA